MPLNLRPLRERAGLSKTAVARRMGVSHPAYLKWEQGMSMPSADRLPALAAVLCCTIDELYGAAAPAAPDTTIIPHEEGN